ncbi:hypothetical protein, partial [Vibrio anguillarum]
QIKMVQNIVKAAMIYAATAGAPSSHPYLSTSRQLHSKLIGLSDKDSNPNGIFKKREQVHTAINANWESRFERNLPENNYIETIAIADRLIEGAIDELHQNGDLGIFSKQSTLTLANHYKQAMHQSLY